MSNVTRELKGVEDLIEEHGTAAQEILDKTDEEDRDPTEAEDEEIRGHLKSIRDLKERKAELEDRVDLSKQAKDRGKDMGVTESKLGEIVVGPTRSSGQKFIESEGYKSLQAKGFQGRFSTGQVELQSKQGTLVEGDGYLIGGTAGSGGALVQPTIVPGVTETLFQRLTVADLFASAQTNSNVIRYVVEGTATPGAEGVAEGGTKPESELSLGPVDEPVKKIATTMKVSDEMLEDAAQVQSYIDSRLSLFVKIEEEAQLVNGAGGADLVGLLGRQINQYPAGTVDDNAIALFKAINGTRGSSFLEPDGIIMNPDDWQDTRLLQDLNGQFYGGGPFTAAYGGANGGPVALSGQVTGAQDAIWGKRVVVTSAIGAGTALLGSFGMAAALYRRSGLTVEATNSNEDDFLNNLVAIRAEERLGLAVYRPTAFTYVTF